LDSVGSPHDTRPTEKEKTMDPQLIEWGPAHLRDEEPILEVEPQEPPDDN
jgi:hypothetical protein